MRDTDADRRQWRAAVMARQAAEVDRLTRTACSGDDAESVCLHWLGALRQAQRYLRGLETRPGADQEKDGHRTSLQGAVQQARAALAEAHPAALTRARSQLGIRVAVIGKGGTGKSLIVGILARLLARRGRPVLAVDFDTNPGLAYSLGVPATAGALSDEAIMEHPGASYGWGLRDGVAPVDVVGRHTVVGPDGVRFLSLGKIDNLDKDAPKRTVVALCELVADFGEPGWDVIGDMEAGPTTPFERYHSFADLIPGGRHAELGVGDDGPPVAAHRGRHGHRRGRQPVRRRAGSPRDGTPRAHLGGSRRRRRRAPRTGSP